MRTLMVLILLLAAPAHAEAVCDFYNYDADVAAPNLGADRQIASRPIDKLERFLINKDGAVQSDFDPEMMPPAQVRALSKATVLSISPTLELEASHIDIRHYMAKANNSLFHPFASAQGPTLFALPDEHLYVNCH